MEEAAISGQGPVESVEPSKKKKKMEVTGREIRTAGTAVHDLTALAPLAAWSPVIHISMDPLRSTWLACDLQQTST